MAFEAEVSPIERKLALMTLQKRDSSVKKILTHAPHAALFHMNHLPSTVGGDPTPTWENGQFRLVLIDNDPQPSTLAGDAWSVVLNNDVVAEQHGHTLHLRTAEGEVFALWFGRPEIADRICSYVGSILSARPLPSPPSPSDLLKMILARSPNKDATSTATPTASVDVNSSTSSDVNASTTPLSQGNQGKAYTQTSTGNSEETNSVDGSPIGHTTNLAGQHILHLLRAGGNGGSRKEPTETSGDAGAQVMADYSGERAPMDGSSSSSSSEEETPTQQQGGVRVDTFQMLEAELSKPNDDHEEKDSEEAIKEESEDGLYVTKDMLREAIIDVVKSDEFINLVIERLSRI
ncbi:hypothetical protein FOL47_010520 [Perkinsus chesapeaki]|uniref:Uncharacterized protein n=1 Tax=Perkinsus chesapeaki TaxID=330153 RepID=A0A7J6MPE0_PERCH|nr:hypothetical protein FOL47_010520 [Perkinsus chesapeaki]